MARGLRATLAALALVLPTAAAAPTATAVPSEVGGWRQQQFDSAHTSFNPRETAVDAATAGRLRLRWVSRPGSNLGIESIEDPVVAGGRVFTITTAGDGHGAVAAFAAGGCGAGVRVCDPLWRTEGLGVHRIAAVDGTVLATAESLLALDAATGEVRWTGRLAGRGLGMAVAGGKVFVAMGSAGVAVFAGAGCGAAECDPLWTASLGPVLRYDAPLVVGGTLLTPALVERLRWRGSVGAFDADGCGAAVCSPEWQAEVPFHYDDEGRWAAAGGLLYVGGYNERVRAYRTTGCGAAVCHPVWVGRATGSWMSSIAVAHGLVYAGTPSEGIHVYAAAGCGAPVCEELWRVEDATDIPIVAGDLLWSSAPGTSGLFAYRATGCGEPVCHKVARVEDPEGAERGAPVVVDGWLYQNTSTGVAAYTLPSG